MLLTSVLQVPELKFGRVVVAIQKQNGEIRSARLPLKYIGLWSPADKMKQAGCAAAGWLEYVSSGINGTGGVISEPRPCIAPLLHRVRSRARTNPHPKYPQYLQNISRLTETRSAGDGNCASIVAPECWLDLGDKCGDTERALRAKQLGRGFCVRE
jgi:hypothetical protein